MQENLNPKAAPWVGVDVSKLQIDAAVVCGEQKAATFKVARTEKELKSLAKKLLSYGPQGVVLEATGGYEALVIQVFEAAGLRVIRMNPQRVRAFAQAEGIRAKTDALDAYVLARFGQRMQPVARAGTEAERRQLATWVARESQVTRMLAVEKTRLQQVEGDRFLQKSIRRAITFLEKELAQLAQQLEAGLAKSETWKAQEALLLSAPGVGAKVARVLFVRLPELGRANRGEITALAGLAPFARDSGKWTGKRCIEGGRGRVRCMLYLASLTVIRGKNPLALFYQRLVAAGKPKKLALIAVTRKLLLALNEMIRTNSPWRTA
jgi:transposase